MLLNISFLDTEYKLNLHKTFARRPGVLGYEGVSGTCIRYIENCIGVFIIFLVVCKVVWTEFIGNKAKGRISKRVFQEKARQHFVSPDTHTYVKHPFWHSPFCLITDELGPKVFHSGNGSQRMNKLKSSLREVRQSFPVQYLPVFGLNTNICDLLTVNFRIKFECEKNNKIASYLGICCTVYHNGHNKQFKAFHFKFASSIVSNFHNLFNSITIAKLRMLNHQKKRLETHPTFICSDQQWKHQGNMWGQFRVITIKAPGRRPSFWRLY